MDYYIYFIGWIIFELMSVHFYWAFGGRKGYNVSIPTNESGTMLFKPGLLECSFVGFGLLAILVILVYKLGLIDLNIPIWLKSNLLYLVSFLFLIRTIGEFKYVGVFKKYKDSVFAEYDTKYFSPLCAFLGLSFFCIEILK